MQVKLSNGDIIYLNKNAVNGVVVVENNYKNIDSQMEFSYSIEIFTGTGMIFRPYTNKNKVIAQEALEKIGSLIEDTKEKTYLEGFKEGTEYALKLIGKE